MEQKNASKTKEAIDKIKNEIDCELGLTLEENENIEELDIIKRTK